MYETIPPGTIATLSRDGGLDLRLARWIAATREHYPGCVRHSIPSGNQIARQRNIAVESMHGEWLLFVDSDCVPSTMLALPLLLRHDPQQAPIVGGVVYERNPIPVGDGTVTFPVAATVPVPDAPGRYRKLTGPETAVPPGEPTLRRVATVGSAFTLIRRWVFEQLDAPWYRCGQLVTDLLGEDSEFCLRAAAAGIPTHLDCEVRVGHRMSIITWPGRDGRRWLEWPFSDLDAKEVDTPVHTAAASALALTD